MKEYILSILGIVVCGILIDVVIPSGNLSKYVKSVYSIFVITVLIMPLINLIKRSSNFTFSYNEIQLQENLADYIIEKRVDNLENKIETYFLSEGFNGIDIELIYFTKNNEICYKSCEVNLKKLLISADKQHINKYEFIKETVSNYTNLNSQEIIISE